MYAKHPEESTMTDAEYLAFEAASTDRHEYSRGRIYAMTGGSVRHGIIAMNIGTHLNNLLGNRNCTVTGFDVRVYIASKSAYRYPDVIVFCGEPTYLAGRNDTITNPVVLVEVLSPGTALIDRNEKLIEYTQIDSLQAYLLVAQDEARIERYMRHESGEWLYSNTTGLEGDVTLPSLECTLALSQVYQKVRFDETTEDSTS